MIKHQTNMNFDFSEDSVIEGTYYIIKVCLRNQIKATEGSASV